MGRDNLRKYRYGRRVNVRRDEPGEDARLRREVGQRIRARRKEIDLNVRQLGELVPNSKGKPTPVTQVSKWERGVNMPKQTQWAPIARALRVGLDQLFAGLVDDEPEWSVSLAARVDELEAEVAALIRVLGLADAVDAAVRGGAMAQERANAEDAKRAAEAGLADDSPKRKRRRGS